MKLHVRRTRPVPMVPHQPKVRSLKAEGHRIDAGPDHQMTRVHRPGHLSFRAENPG